MGSCCKPLSQDPGTEFLLNPCQDIISNATIALKDADKKCSKEDATTLLTEASSPALLKRLSGPHLALKLYGLSKLNDDNFSIVRKTTTWLMALLMMAGVAGVAMLTYTMSRSPVRD